MFGMSMWEILVVLALLFIVVGPGKLPGLAKKLGEQLRGLRQSLADVKATVDKDDEFVKAVTEARQSVAEAKESLRGIFDDVVGVTDDLGLDEAARDPAPKPVPRGRRRVSRARGDGAVALDGDGGAAPGRVDRDREGGGPALAEEPVEAEDWRASAPEDMDGDDGDVAVEDAGGDAPPKAPGEAAPGRVDEGSAGAPVPRRGASGRRMIRPGRSRPDRDGK
jgi:Sec-independent protein translocase protein TatA